jgi:hypothetical protein
MFNQGTIPSCKAALIAFALVFLVSVLSGIGVAGASARGAVVALVAFVSTKVLYHLFFNAVFHEISEYLSKERSAKRR